MQEKNKLFPKSLFIFVIILGMFLMISKIYTKTKIDTDQILLKYNKFKSIDITHIEYVKDPTFLDRIYIYFKGTESTSKYRIVPYIIKDSVVGIYLYDKYDNFKINIFYESNLKYCENGSTLLTVVFVDKQELLKHFFQKEATFIVYNNLLNNIVKDTLNTKMDSIFVKTEKESKEELLTNIKYVFDNNFSLNLKIQ